jgi:fused signal recognition particle receptor
VQLIAVVLGVLIVLAVVAGVAFVATRTRRAERLPGEPSPPAATGTATEVLEAPPAEAQAPPAVEAPPVEAEAPPVEVEPEVVAEPEVRVKPRLRDRLTRTRAAIGDYVRGLRAGGAVDQDTWDRLEEMLLLADVGLDTTTGLLDRVREHADREKVDDADTLVDLLEVEVQTVLTAGTRELAFVPGERNVWMFVGVNGVGKTTSIGKIAQQQRETGRTVLLAAADTFRAAAAEQLGMWGERTGTEVIRGQEGADPGSVLFDAMSSANSKDVDVVLVDTAGRLHTKSNLMEELKKLRRIVDRTEGALKEVLLVIDASTGQNGLTQARQFAEAVDVTGVVLTKLDGTAKGGIVLAIQHDLGIPVKLVGIGETVDDLVEFDPAEFAAALFE